MNARRVLRGTPASEGVAIGPAYLYRPEKPPVPRYTVPDPEAEVQRFQEAVKEAGEQLRAIHAKVLQETGDKETAAIFEAHQMFLDDPMLIDSTMERIRAQHINAEAALADTIEEVAAMFDALEDEYLRARGADLRDVGERILRILAGIGGASLADLLEPSIVVARDLTPSDTAQMDRTRVLGFCTAMGGPTSHTAILARQLGIPAVVGIGEAVMELPAGELLAVDGSAGLVWVGPDEAGQQEFAARHAQWTAEQKRRQEAAQGLTYTADGRRVEVVANIGDVRSAAEAVRWGAEGVGLLRTEFLYLERESMPDEEEQYHAYRQIAEALGDRPLVIRTLDIGGDKQVPYLPIGQELNPFLGWRAVRLCLGMPELFKAQIRAILRASAGHRVFMMFPMIATVEELRAAKTVVEEAKSELRERGLEVPDVPVGIMVEVPAAVVGADILAKEAAFFSIGTNDLIQYSMAIDRTNERVSYLYDPLHPVILRQIHQVIQAGHAAGRWVGMCGEMAGMPEAIPILLGLGLDEFSMNASAIPEAKALIRRMHEEPARQLARRALECETAGEVRELVRAFLADL